MTDKKTEALKLALGALEMHVPHVYKDRGYSPIIAIREALAEQPAQRQEPVAYLDEGLGAFYWAKDYKKDVGFTPLYTSPPIEATPLANANAGKPWAGLDNDDLVWIYSNSDNVGQAISNTESKLKEKNT